MDPTVYDSLAGKYDYGNRALLTGIPLTRQKSNDRMPPPAFYTLEPGRLLKHVTVNYYPTISSGARN